MTSKYIHKYLFLILSLSVLQFSWLRNSESIQIISRGDLDGNAKYIPEAKYSPSSDHCTQLTQPSWATSCLWSPNLSINSRVTWWFWRNSRLDKIWKIKFDDFWWIIVMHQYKIGNNVKTFNLRWTLFETDFEIQTWLNALSDFFATD